MEISFPVLSVNDFAVRRYELKKVNDFWLDQGLLKPGTLVIDSTGSCRTITRFERVRKSWFLLDLLDRYPWYYINLSLGPSTQLSLGEIKALVIEAIVRKNWHAQGGESRSSFETR